MGYFTDSYSQWCLGPDQKDQRSNNQGKKKTPVTDQPGRQNSNDGSSDGKMGNHVGRSPIVNQPGKVAGMARQYENDVIDTQPSKGRPLPHNETNHVDRTPVMSRHPSRQASQESPMARRSKDGSYHSTPGSGGHSHHSIQSKGSRKGGPPEMCETATSPDGSYHGHERITKEFEVDYPIVKPAPKQKTKIVYDLGSPQMNTQGINASIPVTTDKYTYTITSVLSSMSHQQNDSPLSSPTSGSKRPISSYKIIQPNPNPKIGKWWKSRPELEDKKYIYLLSILLRAKIYFQFSLGWRWSIVYCN